MAASMAAVASEVDEEAAYERLACDPAIHVSDLERAINKYCDGIGYSNLDDLAKAVAGFWTGWKSSAKAIVV